MNTQSCRSAQPCWTTAVAMLRAGLTEVLLTGMLTRCTSVSVSPMVSPAMTVGPALRVAARITNTKIAVQTSSTTTTVPTASTAPVQIGTIAVPSAVGTFGTDPAYPSFVWVAGNGGYLVSAEGSDIWNTADGCNFGWELKTNNFDVVVRGVTETPTSSWAKEGLMVRETLDANSREWCIVNEPLAADGGANRIDTGVRDTTGGSSVNWSIGSLPAPSYPNAWLQLKRTISSTNDLLDGYYSTNGTVWVHATSYNIATNATPLANVVMVGICTTAHNNDVVSSPAPSSFLYYNTAEYADYTSSYIEAVPQLYAPVISGGNLQVTWANGGHLEASPVLGPGANWQTIGTASPAVIPIGKTNQFFRVVRP